MYQRIGKDKCGSFWFTRFALGCQNRMGAVSRQNKDLSMPLLLLLLEYAENKVESVSPISKVHKWSVFSAYVAVSHVISLRGNETFYLDLDGLNRHTELGGEDYFITALFGQIKGETSGSNHIIPCINVASSGIRIRDIVFRLIKQKRAFGFVKGQAISDHKGVAWSTRFVDDLLVTVFEDLYQDHARRFPTEVRSALNDGELDLREILSRNFSCFRTFRRTSDSRALEMRYKLKKEDVEVVNRWRALELSKGKKPKRAMKHHCADVQILLKPFLRYTTAM